MDVCLSAELIHKFAEAVELAREVQGRVLHSRANHADCGSGDGAEVNLEASAAVMRSLQAGVAEQQRHRCVSKCCCIMSS